MSTVQQTQTEAEIQVAAAALAEFVGAPDSLGVLRLYSTLQARTASFPDSAVWAAGIDGFGLDRTQYPNLVGSYWLANRHARMLHEPLRVPGWRVLLVDTTTERALRSATIHYVSRVGIGPSGDSALVAIDALCGQLCGHGVLMLYIRSPRGWRVASVLQSLRY